MKATKTLILVLIASLSYSQERTTLSVGTEPKAFEKDGFNISTKFTYQSTYGYLGVGLFAFPDLNHIGYYSASGNVGFNFNVGYFDKHRFYLGVLLGLARRSNETYPLTGYEAGYEYYFSKRTGIGVNGAMHYRADADFYEGPKNVFNGEVKILFRLDRER